MSIIELEIMDWSLHIKPHTLINCIKAEITLLDHLIGLNLNMLAFNTRLLIYKPTC